MRIVKEHEERKNEIIKAAAVLFSEKGYEACSVNDILNAVGIAKGTFYYYFKSKEDVLDAAVMQMSEQILAQVREAAGRKELSPIERIIRVLLAARVADPAGEVFIQEMHKSSNALLHQKTLVFTLRMLTPVLAEIVEEGNTAGIFHCAYPEQSTQILLSATLTLLDDGIFPLEEGQAEKIFEAMVYAMEKLLGVKTGVFFEKMCAHWDF